MLKTATETPSLASSQEGDVASIFQTCEREKAREQNLSLKATRCWEVRKNWPPLATATGGHQLDSLCEGEHPHPSPGKLAEHDSSMGKKFIEEFLGLFPHEYTHGEDSYSTLATGLSSHELDRVKSNTSKASLMSKRTCGFYLGW